MKIHDIGGLLKQTYTEWSEDKAPRLGAALAYYAVFSIPPLVLLTISIIGLVYHGDVSGAIQKQVATLIGPDAARTIMETGHQQNSDGGVFTAVAGIALLIFGATGVFAELQDALNTIWDVKPKGERGIAGMVKDRFLSFTMILGIAFLLLVSLVLSAAVATVGSFVPGGEAVGHLIELGLSFVVTAALFAMIFKVLPDVKIAWSDVWAGAIVTAALFTLGKFAIGIYLGKSSVASTYGAAGSLIIMIIWVYYSAQILFLGAEFTQVYANRYGSHLVPSENAEPAAEGKPAAVRAEVQSERAEAKVERKVIPFPVASRQLASTPGSASYGLAVVATMMLGFFAGRKTSGTSGDKSQVA